MDFWHERGYFRGLFDKKTEHQYTLNEFKLETVHIATIMIPRSVGNHTFDINATLKDKPLTYYSDSTYSNFQCCMGQFRLMYKSFVCGLICLSSNYGVTN